MAQYYQLIFELAKNACARNNDHVVNYLRYHYFFLTEQFLEYFNLHDENLRFSKSEKFNLFRKLLEVKVDNLNFYTVLDLLLFCLCLQNNFPS